TGPGQFSREANQPPSSTRRMSPSRKLMAALCVLSRHGSRRLDYENLRSALACLLERRVGPQACRLVGALRLFWAFEERVSDGRDACRQRAGLLQLRGPGASLRSASITTPK